MLAFLAAVCFGIQLIVKPDWEVSMVVLGLLFIALHLAFADQVTTLWTRRRV